MKFDELKWQLREMNSKMDSVKSTVAAVLAKELAPHIPIFNTPSQAVVTTVSQVDISQEVVSTTPPTIVPATPPTIVPATPPTIVSTTPLTNVPATPPTNVPATPPSIVPVTLPAPTTQVPSLVGNPQPISIQQLEGGPISVQELTNVFTKSSSRRNFAARLVRCLFTEEVRMNSNVNGRGKEMLDPTLIAYVKAKSFEFFPLSGGEKLKEKWAECVIAIDEVNRRLKNKPSKKQQN